MMINIEKIKVEFPQIEIETDRYSNLNFKSWFASYNGGDEYSIKSDWSWTRLLEKTDLNDHFLTEADARNAIKNVIPNAKEKFLRINEAIEKIESELNCSIGGYVDGDTHGVDYFDSISFTLNGFSFIFPR